MAGIGLADGARLAVIGAGPSGGAFASALLASARAFGRRIEVVIYDGAQPGLIAPPAILDVDARYRLASLGAPVPLRQGAIEARGVLISAQGRSALLETTPGSLWILDGVGGTPGSRMVKQALLTAASLRGAGLRPWRVDEVVPVGKRFVVRAQGSSETFDAVVGAFGAASPLSAHWLDEGFRPPRRLLGSHARLALPVYDELVRAYLAPSAEIDLLTVVPSARGEAYCLGAGQDVSPSALARALAMLVRDGALPGPVEIRRVERVALSAGATHTLAREGSLTLGAAAWGTCAAPGLLASLVGAMRAASALLEAGTSAGLESRAARSQSELAAHARRQEKILRWALRAGPRAPETAARVASAPGGPLPAPALPVLGIGALGSARLLDGLRWSGVRQGLSRLFERGAHAQPCEPSRSLVFVVDDDPDVRAVLVDFLTQRGTTVRAFSDELALLDAAARDKPGAILLDVVLRWVDGFSLCRALRNHPATARSRLISMSGLNRRSDRDAALAAGADAFLPKPIDLAALERALAGVVLPPLPGADVAHAQSG